MASISAISRQKVNFSSFFCFCLFVFSFSSLLIFP
jgi:hypothetical protein